MNLIKKLIYLIIPFITVIICLVLKLAQGEKNEEIVLGIIIGLIIDFVYAIFSVFQKEKKTIKNIKKNNFLLNIVSLISIILIFVLKFILKSNYGFFELFLTLVSFILITISIVKNFNNNILKMLLILMVIWFTLLAVDYKRHKNMYQPLFAIKNENKDYVGLGYKIVKEYNQKGDYIYQSYDKFYLFGILLNTEKQEPDFN